MSARKLISRTCPPRGRTNLGPPCSLSRGAIRADFPRLSSALQGHRNAHARLLPMKPNTYTCPYAARKHERMFRSQILPQRCSRRYVAVCCLVQAPRACRPLQIAPPFCQTTHQVQASCAPESALSALFLDLLRIVFYPHDPSPPLSAPHPSCVQI